MPLYHAHFRQDPKLSEGTYGACYLLRRENDMFVPQIVFPMEARNKRQAELEAKDRVKDANPPLTFVGVFPAPKAAKKPRRYKALAAAK